jgi:hypothetical protein
MNPKTDSDIVAVTVAQPWKDGNFMEVLREYGYPVGWIPGRVRTLPRSLVRRLADAGAQITIPGDDAPEDRIIVPAPPRPEPSEQEREDHAAQELNKAPHRKVVFLASFADGNLRAELAAAGHPHTFWKQEVISLPIPLLEKIQLSGGKFSDRPADLEEAEREKGIQNKYQTWVRKWQEEHDAARKRAEEGKARAGRETEVRAEIEKLSGRYIAAQGKKTREALKLRIDELYLEIL